MERKGMELLLSNVARPPQQQGLYSIGKPVPTKGNQPKSPKAKPKNGLRPKSPAKVAIDDTAQPDKNDRLGSRPTEAAAAEFFSGNSPSDSGDEMNSETIFSHVYHDPLDECMEAIEDLATGILRTGKLTIQGEPGDMNKLQPMLFGLQATEKDLPLLLPQLMQMPFFNQVEDQATPWANGSVFDAFNMDFLSTGHIRIGLPIDTAIYHLLHSHCVKGAKQAEGIIKTSQASISNLTAPASIIPQLPPVIFPSVLSRPSPMLTSPPPYFNGFRKLSTSEDPASPQTATDPEPSSTMSNQLSGSSITSSTMSNQVSGSSITSYRTSTSSFVSSVSSLDGIMEDEPSILHASPPPTRSRGRTRKITRPHLTHTSSSELSGDENEKRSRRNTPENVWQTRIVDNRTIVGMYSNSSYPLMMWNSDLQAEFHMVSSFGLIASTVTGIDPSQPTVSMKVKNNSQERLAFSIRVYHQSAVFKSHVIYPTTGLHVLEKDQCWEESAEFLARVQDKNDYFVVDLFVCTLDGQPSWNVIRRYAVIKAARKSSTSNPSPLTPKKLSRKMSYAQLPGNLQQKEENLKQTMAHGLQCVVKSKLDEAEVIFSQALLLPEFQRVPLKAFAYICLAVIANKRRKAGQIPTILPMVTHVNNANILVEECESAPGVVKMPRTLQLVKQLRKELNITRILKDQKKKERKGMPLYDKSVEECDEIGPEGGTVSHNHMTLAVPPGALKTPTRITLSKPKMKQLNTMLSSTGWDRMVRILTAFHIQCAPPTEQFETPINIVTTLSSEPRHSMIRLLQSNYLRQWQDITDDIHSKVVIMGKQVQVTTDHVGWLAVAVIDLNPSKVAQMAMSCLSAESMTLCFSVYGQVFPDNVIQIATIAAPSQQNSEPMNQPEHYFPISFPHTVQVWPGERLRISLQGKFSPDVSSGEKDLSYEFEAQQSYNQICEKWVRLTSKADQPLGGKLVVSACRSGPGSWESIAEINLSSRTAFTNNFHCS